MMLIADSGSTKTDWAWIENGSIVHRATTAGINPVHQTEEDIEKVVNGKWKYEEQRGDSNGIGMDNVISRLRLLSEREDVIDIYSEGEDMGTEVVINIPYTLDNQKED